MYLQICRVSWWIWWYLIIYKGISSCVWICCLRWKKWAPFVLFCTLEYIKILKKPWIKILNLLLIKSYRYSSYRFICSALKHTKCVRRWYKNRVVIVDILYNNCKCCLCSLQERKQFDSINFDVLWIGTSLWHWFFFHLLNQNECIEQFWGNEMKKK